MTFNIGRYAVTVFRAVIGITIILPAMLIYLVMMAACVSVRVTNQYIDNGE